VKNDVTNNYRFSNFRRDSLITSAYHSWQINCSRCHTPNYFCNHRDMCFKNRLISLVFTLLTVSTFSASLTNLSSLLPQSHDCTYYVSRSILAPPPLWLIYAHTTSRSLPKCDIDSRLANLTWAWSWRLCAINLCLPLSMCTENGGINNWSQIIWVQVQTRWQRPTLKQFVLFKLVSVSNFYSSRL